MRLFVAIRPPGTVLAELDAALADARAAARQLRWTAAEQWHLTLAFFAEVPDARLPELEERLARAAHRCPALALRLAGAGHFGNRVLYVKVDGDLRPLGQLAASAGAAARRAGIDVEERRYHAHLTLARAGREAEDLRPVAALLQPFAGSAWTATAVELLRSRLGQGAGGRSAYESLASWRLDGPSRRVPPP